MTIATYHNHSRWSDGKASIDEVVAAARRLGVEELGLSDHFMLHPSGRTRPWAMPPERLGEYIADVLAQRGSTPVVRLGLEVDWFSGATDRIAPALSPHPFDYLIGSVHEIDDFEIDGSPAAWGRLDTAQQNEMHRQYWLRMRELAESGLFDVAAHLDLTKKFGHAPTVDITSEIDAALDAIAASGMVVELNTAGWHKPCAEAYPAPAILRGCRARGIPVTISADAHDPDHLLRDFDRAAALLAETGFTHVARFAGRRMRLEPLQASPAT